MSRFELTALVVTVIAVGFTILRDFLDSRRNKK